MTNTGVFALLAIIGAALLIHEADRWWTKRRNSKRLMKIVMANQCCCEQAKRDTPMTPAQRKIALHEQRG